MKNCKKCNKSFEVEAWDIKFYKQMSVPEPTLCPDCRAQRRRSHVNQIYLFKRVCDATSEPIITNYPPKNKCKVYSQKYWFSDDFDAIKFGRDFDFSRPFFDQFHELSKIVPRPALFTDYTRDENSAYTNDAGKNKNCYLIFDSDENWDCFYSFGMNSSQNSCDCFRVQKLQLCYEAVDSNNCYNCAFIQNCENCFDCAFLQNCIGCRNCFFSSNLRQKQYYVFNKPASKEDCEEFKKLLGSHKFTREKIAEFAKYKLQFPQKFIHGFHNENVLGDYLVHCKNALHVYDSMNVWDAKYCVQMFMKSKNCMDTDEGGEAELLYECTNLGYNAYNLRFCMHCLNEVTNLTYCDLCFGGCSNLFGCVGLRKKEYCILNKQYTQEGFSELSLTIIEHMKKNGEWGEFFPSQISVIPYNITRADDYFPLTKEEALREGLSWHDDEPQNKKTQQYNIPDHIAEVKDDILKAILVCETCGKNFKIIPEELAFYKQVGIPIPRQCFYCRHKVRKSLRNPRHLWPRNCQKCNTEILTTYSPQRPEIVFCEKCYLEAVD